MPNVEVPIPAGTLSIHKVSVRIPRSKIESWYGPGTALKTGITGYGQLYSDGFRTHYPLEVEYSARDLAVRISGNELYRGNQRVRVQQAKGGEIVLPGLCKGQLATAMLQGPANPEEYHFSGILDGPMIEPPDARISIYLLDDYTWFTIW